MLKKLYAYHIKALSKKELICVCSMLGAGLLALLIFLLINALPASFSGTQGGLAILYALLVVGPIAGLAVGMILLYVHYYKNFFTDEGYLTFSLPATVHQQLLSKVFAGVTYSVILSITCIIAFLIACVVPISIIASGKSLAAEFVAAFKAMLVPTAAEGGLILLSVIATCIRIFSQILLIYTAITLGSLILTKHKILGSFLFFFVVSIAVEVFTFFLGMLFGILLQNSSPTAVNYGIAVANVLIQIFIALSGYFLSHYMLSHKLNLE